MMEFAALGLGIFLLAGTIKGATGIGLPMAAIALLTLFVDPRAAMAATVLPIMVSNLMQMWRARDLRGAVRRYWPFAAMLVVTLYLTGTLAGRLSSETLLLALGVSVMIFAIVGLAGYAPHLADRWERPAQWLFGVACGVMGGLTGIWSPPMVVFFLMRRTPKEEFVGAAGFILSTGSVPLCAALMTTGDFAGDIIWISALMVVPTFLGFTLGERIRARLDAERFQRVVLVVFLLIGLNMIRRALA